jgi:drug/metabolite transporter (DMT)-like permease
MFTRLLLLFTVIVWGWTFVATKICLAYVSPAELLGLRLLIALPILLIVIIVKKVRFEFSRGDYGRILLGSLVITSHFLIQITGLQYTTATNTGWIISVTPLIMAVLSFLFLKERIGVAQVLAIAVATSGILLLMSRGDLTSLGWLRSTGDWLVLVSAHTWAIYTVVTRDLARSKNPHSNPIGGILLIFRPGQCGRFCFWQFQGWRWPIGSGRKGWRRSARRARGYFCISSPLPPQHWQFLYSRRRSV